MAEVREGLLQKKNKVDYYENCPGCKIDKLKETTPGPPFKHLLYVFIVVLAAGAGPASFICLVWQFSILAIWVFDNERVE